MRVLTFRADVRCEQRSLRDRRARARVHDSRILRDSMSSIGISFARVGQQDGHVATLIRWQQRNGDVRALAADEEFVSCLLWNPWGVDRVDLTRERVRFLPR